LRLIFFVIISGLFLGKSDEFFEYFFICGIICLVFSYLFQHWFFFFIAIFSLSLGYAKFYNFTQNIQFIQQQALLGKSADIIGYIDSFPTKKNKNYYVYIQVTQLKFRENFTNYKTRILVKIPHQKLDDLNLHYGHVINFKGKFVYPENSRDFDYQTYLKQFNVIFVINYPKNIKLLNYQAGNWLIKLSSKFREIFAKNIKKAIPEPHSIVAEGVLLGVQQKFPKNIENWFKNSGLQHLLVVSGTNVTLLILFIGVVFSYFGRIIVFMISCLTILLFTFMVGFDPPVLRAACFGILVGFGVLLGRFTEIQNLLLLTACLLGIFNPIMLQMSVSFWLSFTATLGLLFIAPMVYVHLEFLQKFKKFRLLLAFLIGAQVGVFPVVAYIFGVFPFAGFLSNILTEPLVPILMLSSFIAGFSGLFMIKLFTTILAIPAYIFIEILFGIAYVFAQFGVLKISPDFAVFIGIITGIIYLFGCFSNKFQVKYLNKLEQDLLNI